ncbi:MAG: ribosomal RNA small subunit methyltransferase A [Pirellulaceae bacterium]|nr:MAG: ribosomal RNA small subunit methyltransferase A [Pirellulaceae bacterium]
MSVRQTLSFLRQRFEEVGLRPDTRQGQNFLIDLNLLDVLVRAAELTPQDVVLEVGTGTGSLTARLAAQAGWVVTVEIDRNLCQLAREHLGPAANVTFLQQDALKSKHVIAPELLEHVQDRMSGIPGARFKLVANLPYHIATPLITNLLETPLVPERFVVTIQREVADRLTARPSSKDYGSLSVWVQSQCTVRVLRELPPDVFWPRPKVSSSIVQIIPQAELRQAIADPGYFHKFVRTVFLHRRKLLRGTLAQMYDDLSKEQVQQILESQGLAADVRAEQLTWQQLLELSEKFRAVHPSLD